MSSSLWAISSIDGRYRNKLGSLSEFFSEGALILRRIQVELAWLGFLAEECHHGRLAMTWRPNEHEMTILAQAKNADFSGAPIRVKEIEEVCNHDVKAVEYFLKEYLKDLGFSQAGLAMIHFACTSEDVNNLAYSLIQRDVTRELVLPQMDEVVSTLSKLAHDHAGTPMLARTHGQTASPTTVGKEFVVFAHRMNRQIKQLRRQEYFGKINGAVGNFNAHAFVDQDCDWQAMTKRFVEHHLGLVWTPISTQIESHDGIAEWCDCLKRFASIGLDLCKDVWAYISIGYFSQKTSDQEVGSSTMPHKVNPIDFENAEGNWGLGIALAEHFSAKLPVSRWQRDLSDSTVLRVLGSMLAHHCLAQQSLLKGLGKISLNYAKISSDLDESIEVLAEPIQTAMRARGICDAYERLKLATRGKEVLMSDFHRLIDSCEQLELELKIRLKQLHPRTYTGIAECITKEWVNNFEMNTGH